MDFENMKRKQLQALCKEHGIPANLTNSEMVNKLSSLLKVVNDEKPLTRGRSCLKILDENVSDRESDVVNRKVKKVKFSPDNEIIEFTRSVGAKRRGRRKTMMYKNELNSNVLKVGSLDSPLRVTRSQRVNIEDGVTEKKGGKRNVKDSVVSVNESKDEVGRTTRSSRNKQVVLQEKGEEKEGVNDGLPMNRRVRSWRNAEESVEVSKEEMKIDNLVDKKEIDRAEKKEKKVTFINGGQMNEFAKSETEAKETKGVTRRKLMAHVQNEVDAEVREEVVEKPARVTRSRNLKPVEDNVGNRRNSTRGKEAIESIEEEVRVNTRRSQQISVEAPQEALKRSGRVANKAKGAKLTDDISKEKIVTRGRTRNQSNLIVEASTAENGTETVELKEKLEEPVEVPPRISDRRKSVIPLENLRGDNVVDKKEKRNPINFNYYEQGNKGTKAEPQKASKRSKRAATQVEDSVLVKDDIPENVVVPVRSSRRKSVAPALENVRSDEVAIVKEKRKSKTNEDVISSKGIKEESQKASKRSKRLAKQVEDPVFDKGDIAENKLEERRCSRRNAAKANVDTKILDRSVKEETSVIKEERRRSGRTAARHTLAAVSDDKKEAGENKLPKRTCTIVQEKDSTNKFALEDLDSLKQSPSSSKSTAKAAVAQKSSIAGKKQQHRLKRSNVEVEVPITEDIEVSRKPENKDCNILGSAGSMSFSRSSLNEVEPALDDVNIVLAGSKDITAAELSTLSDKLNEEEPLVDVYSSPSENDSTSKSLPFSDRINSEARPQEDIVEGKFDGKEPASESPCPSPVSADDALPNDISSDKQEPDTIAADSTEELGTGVSNEVLKNHSLSQSDRMEENLDSGTAAELSNLADRLNEEGPLVDANASPSESNSTLKCPPHSDPFNSKARPEKNVIEELLQSDHEEPASKGLCPSSVLADDAVPNDITSDKQETGATAVHNAEEFVTGLSTDVLDNCSLRQSDNMEENFDSGTKDDAAAESSTLTDKLIQEGPLGDANGSPYENNSISNPFSDSFNSNARPEENLDEELLLFEHEAPASKDLCPSSALAEDTVRNSDQQEHGVIAAADNAEGLSDVDFDNCSLSQSDDMEENLDSGFKEQLETGCVVTGGVACGEQEPTCKGLCPSSAFTDDAVLNDITQEHGEVAADDAEEFDTGLSNEVLDNMEESLDAGIRQSETECIVIEGVINGEQELESKDLYPSSDLAEYAVPNDIIPDKLEQGAPVADNAEEFDTGSANEVLDNCSVNQSDNVEEKLDSGFKEHSETRCISSVGVNYGEEELIVTDNAKEFVVGLSSNASLDNVGAFSQSNEMKIENSESGPMEQTEAESDTVEAEYDLDTIALHETPSDHSDEEKQGEEFKILFATPWYAHSKKEKEASLDGDSRDEDLNSEGQGEYLKNLFSTPFGIRSSKAEKTCINIYETSRQYKHSCHKNENSPLKETSEDKAGKELKSLFTTPSVVSQSVAPLKDTLEDEAGEELKSMYATPSVVSQSVAPSKDTSEDEAREELKLMFAMPSVVSQSVAPSKDTSEDEAGEELKSMFATPSVVSQSVAPSKDTSEDEAGEELKSMFATPSVVSQSVAPLKDTSEDEAGEELKSLFATPSVVSQSIAPFKDTSEDEAGEELKSLFATPLVVSQSVGGQHFLFQSQLGGEAMTSGKGLGSSGKENINESISGLIEDKQVVTVEHIRTLVSLKCTNQESTTTKGKYSQSHEMETYSVSGVGRNLSEYVAGTVIVDQAPETSHITAFNNSHENEQEGQLRMLFASPIITQSLDKMDGTSRKTQGKKNLLSGNVQGHSHNKVSPVAQLSSVDLDEPERMDSKLSETTDCLKESSPFEVENNEGQGNMLSATSDKSMTPVWNDKFSSQEPTVKETAECMKEFNALEQENNEEGQVNMLYPSADKSMTPLWNDKFSSQQPMVKETAECMKESSALEVENNEGRGNMLSMMSAINMTPLPNSEFSSQEPKRADVAMPGEMFRDTEKNTRHECCVQEAVDIEAHKIKETSRGLEEDIYAGIAKESTSPVISEPTCDDIGFSKQQMVPEINKSSLKNAKRSDAYNEDTEDHLKLLFATPTKGTSPSTLGEASSCQLKTAMITMVSEIAGKQPKKGSEFSGEPLTVEFISGCSNGTKGSGFSKGIEQFERGPLFPTPSKGTSPLQLEENLCCEEDIFKDLDGVKFINPREQDFAQEEDCQLIKELTDDTGEATLNWFQSNDDSAPRQTELETQKENDSAYLFKPLHEKGEVAGDDLAESKEDDHLVAYQESLEDRLINTDEAANGAAAGDAVCQQPNILLPGVETESTTQESIRKTDGISDSAGSRILEYDAESTALRSQETIITVDESKGDEVQKLEERNISKAFLQNVPNDDEYAKEISIVLPADEQFHFPEHHVIQNVSSTEEFTASTNECQHVSSEDDLAAEGDRLVILESNESKSMNVNGSGLTTQINLPGIFTGESGNKAHSALSEEPRSEIDQGMSSAARQQDEDSFGKKVHESAEAVLSPSSKSRENISFIEEGFAGEEDTLMSEKKNDLAEKKVPSTPAGVGKTSFAKPLKSTVKKNARSILIHGTPNKLSQIVDMKENASSVKGDIGTLTALRPVKRPALKDLSRK